MTENLGAAVPSEPTTPGPDLENWEEGTKRMLRWLAGDTVHAGLLAMELRLWADHVEPKSARGEVGPSPEQITDEMIERGARALFLDVNEPYEYEWSQQLPNLQRRYEERARAVLVAACSVRGPEKTK